MTPRSPLDAVAGVNEDDGDVGVGGAGEGVAGVALVARGVGQHVTAGARWGEEPIGDVDRDALFPLTAQPVRERRQVELALVVGHAFDVVGRQGNRCRAGCARSASTSVVDTADGGQAQELAVAVVAAGRGGLSMVGAVIRSSPPVCGPPWQRSTCGRRRGSPSLGHRRLFHLGDHLGSVVAVDRTAPVMVRSPTVR